MDRMRAPVEFGFPTAPYIPPEHPRPLWRTLLFSALIALIPIVGPGVSAVYVDRRRIPGTYSAADAVKTALIQVVAILLLTLVVWLIVTLVLGYGIELNPRLVPSRR
jgi:hypothetical protein